MTSTYTIPVTDLPKADLIIGNTYEGGKKGNAGDDPLSKLMRCENQGGFRPVGARNGVNTKFCVLYSDLSHDEWSNRIELETGKFYYYGDNRKAGRGIHETVKKGNLILRYSFDEYQDGNRKNIPPFFVFAKGKKGRDVIFRGLAVPGAVDENNSDSLKVISHESAEGAIPNYLSIFTILDVQTIKRAWIEDLHKGEPFTVNAPGPWLEWINTGKYIPLKEKTTIDYSNSYEIDKSGSKYWLFNVFYSQNPVVWENSKQMSVAAMQYENGKETASSVTKQLKIIKDISVGDYIVAYTGAKGFLGYGRVIKEFYEEEDKDKFINASGGTWKQRVGVNWIKNLALPIKYTGSKFMQDVGVKGNPVMSSSTIFEISGDGFQFVKNLIDNKPVEKVIEKPERLLTNKELIDHIHSYITSKGFHYSRDEVINLFLSLKTKPFVILSGISGTGKTKIVQWFAESVGATEENGRFTLIPVRPDWNDSSDLLGYVDIKDDFKPGPLTKVIEEAEKNPFLPYFVLLDEMNLARVEHYFSDILSVMESRKWQGEEIVTSTLLTAETAKRTIKLPTNLYIIGTVNMDETTHPFSKKVLDRANTIEFNRVELTNLDFLEDREVVEAIPVSDNKFRAKYLHLKDLYVSNKGLVERVTAELENLNKSLLLINAHVGYRVRDEVCFYLDYNENSNLMDFEIAFDHCILQKILPRISGSDKRVERLLNELYRSFTGREYIENQDSYEDELKQATYKKSAAKVVEMLRRLKDDGFTSFWVS